jgi:hypothetical protein
MLCPSRAAAAWLVALCASTPAFANLDVSRTNGIKWLIQNQRGDGSLVSPHGFGIQATAAAADALRLGGLAKAPQLARAASWLANSPDSSVDARAWKIKALVGGGADVATLAGTIRDDRNRHTLFDNNYSSLVSWGPYRGYTAGTLDTVLAFGALRESAFQYANDSIEFTLSVQCLIMPATVPTGDWAGSWPHFLPRPGQAGPANIGSLAATSAVAYELKKSLQANRFAGDSCTTINDVANAVIAAKTWLIAQAEAGGGFSERDPQTSVLEAPSVIGTAMAIRALAVFAAEGDAAATTAVANARNWLSSQQQANGSWGGDALMTARAVAAMPAASGTYLADADNDGIPDAVEVALGTQSTVADAQTPLATSAAAVSGVTATAFSAQGTVGQPFSLNVPLPASGGSPTVMLRNGALPPGLRLSIAGTIGGTPSAAGEYSFDYEVTATGGAKTLTIGFISVSPHVPSGEDAADIPLPDWALAGLGVALVATLARRKRRGQA